MTTLSITLELLEIPIGVTGITGRRFSVIGNMASLSVIPIDVEWKYRRSLLWSSCVVGWMIIQCLR